MHPWIEICAEPDEVENHLAHGDCLGSCDFSKNSAIPVDEGSDWHFDAFPNPAINQVTIKFISSSEAVFMLELADMTGRKLKEFNGKAFIGENSVEIDLAGIQSGIYIMKIVVDKNKGSRKLIIE
jgi:hypothetical protein